MRRRVLKAAMLLGATGLAAGATLLAAQSGPTPPAAAPAASAVPYLDAHSHVLPGMTMAEEVGIFRQTGLAGFILMDPVADSLKAVRQGNEGYAMASVSIARLPTMPGIHMGPEAAAAMAKVVDDGLACGFGEIPTRTMPRTEPGDAEALVSPDRMAIYRAADQRGIPVSLHVDIVDARVEASLDRIATEFPRARFILAHSGWSSGPEPVARLMDAHANVMGDLSVRFDPASGVGGGAVISILTGDGTVKPEWAALIRRHPDRFLFAMDLSEQERPRHAAELLAAGRKALAPMGAQVENAVAHGNLERLYAACPGRIMLTKAAAAAPQPDTGHADALAMTAARKGAPRLVVTSPSFVNDANVPFDNTAYGANRFPGLSWNAGPKRTRSYVAVVQGELPGGKGRSSIHVVTYNIPASARSLPTGMTTPPAGARFGPNVHGLDEPWTGPHTHTTARQAYHFQVLALDRVLPNKARQTWPELWAAMQGHVLAAGDMVGWSAKP